MLLMKHISLFARGEHIPWHTYVYDSVLALLGVAGVTAILFWFRLYPRIPNISIVYLLMILPLATLRGRYAASVAAVLTFLAFDFFLVPPIFTLTISNPDEWIALVVFLIDALLTGYLASALRQRAEDASRRECETQALYYLLHTASREEKPMGQLQAMCRAVVEILVPWGVQECVLLQRDPTGTLTRQAQASISQPPQAENQREALRQPQPSRAANGKRRRSALLNSLTIQFRKICWLARPDTQVAAHHSQHVFPLKLGEKTVGALQLSVMDGPHTPFQAFAGVEGPCAERSSFFSTFLNQVAALLERARFQQETLHMELLQRTDALRASLLSSVSHDLRTPLTAIKAAASTLLQRSVQWDEGEQRGFLHTIEQEADRLNRLVANLLDMSRIEEGALKPDKDWYSITALLQDVLGRLAPLVKARHVQLHLPDDLLLAELDYLMIDQVLTNLIENAVHYTPAHALIEIEARREGDHVMVSVADRGPGLSAAQLEHIFDKFYRVLYDHSSHGGSGLGLTVCRGLVEAHSGRIWAEDRAGGGLVMRMVLPMGDLERIQCDE